jgi:hypothetical protein
MTMTVEDFSLYFQTTFVYVDDVLSYIYRVQDAETKTKYKVITQPVLDNVYGPSKEFASNGFMRRVKPFVPEYGYIFYDGFACYVQLGAYRMARKAFTLDRINIIIPNVQEHTKYLSLKHTDKQGWYSQAAFIRALADPKYSNLKESVPWLFDGQGAGVALSKDFALVSYLGHHHLGLMYKTKEVAHVDEKGKIEWQESARIFEPFFNQQQQTILEART